MSPLCVIAEISSTVIPLGPAAAGATFICSRKSFIISRIWMFTSSRGGEPPPAAATAGAEGESTAPPCARPTRGPSGPDAGDPSNGAPAGVAKGSLVPTRGVEKPGSRVPPAAPFGEPLQILSFGARNSAAAPSCVGFVAEVPAALLAIQPGEVPSGDLSPCVPAREPDHARWMFIVASS